MTDFVLLRHSLSWAGTNTSFLVCSFCFLCCCFYGCKPCRALLSFGMLLGTKCSFPASSTTGLRLFPLISNIVPLLLPLQEAFLLALRSSCFSFSCFSSGWLLCDAFSQMVYFWDKTYSILHENLSYTAFQILNLATPGLADPETQLGLWQVLK